MHHQDFVTLRDSTPCPHSVFTCFVCISQQEVGISLHSINWLDFYNRDGVCLLRSASWVFKYYSGQS
jgi:hypothetical protein